MTDAEFWKLIDSSVADDEEEQIERLRGELLKLTPQEVVSFDEHLRRRLNEAYRHDLWGAAYLINDGASDDGFEYFRLWLIGRGQRAFESVLKDPDSLATLVPEDIEYAEFESLLYVAPEVYEELTSQPLPPSTVELPAQPAGEPWDFDDDDAMQAHLPKVSARFMY